LKKLPLLFLERRKNQLKINLIQKNSLTIEKLNNKYVLK